MSRMLVAWLLLPTWALAGEPPAEPEDMDIEGVAGKPLPGLGDKVPQLPDWRQATTIEDVNARPYANVVYQGAAALELEPDYVARTRDGFSLVFERKYKAARQHFVALDQDFPGTGISASVDALVWQALMLENFDFRYDKQYAVSNAKAIKDLEAAVKAPGRQGWEHFQMAGLMGVEAIHMVRHGTYLPALSRAFEAMDHAQKAREASPDYLDLDLADGMYNYWRTVVTMSSKMLPDFGDNRALGLAQLERVASSGVFLADPANLALAFSWLEERDYKKAANACASGRRKYPDNVINNLLAGQTYIQLRKYDQAIGIFNEIIEDAPDNNRVYYFLGLAYLRKDEPQTAVKHLERYMSSDVLEDWQQATGHYRLGQAYYRLKSYAKADSHYHLAVKANGLQPAKAALDRMRDLKKAGKISY